MIYPVIGDQTDLVTGKKVSKFCLGKQVMSMMRKNAAAGISQAEKNNGALQSTKVENYISVTVVEK